MTNMVLNQNNRTQTTSWSTDIKRPPRPLRPDSLTVFVGWTQGGRGRHGEDGGVVLRLLIEVAVGTTHEE